ncbi:MAG: YqhA family protein [Deltaproteobacteria bacterium]|nr:YqhA family protein [Deltaproteobacteria bacterium]
MKKLLSNSRYLVLIAVFASLITSVMAFLWGAYKTFTVLSHLVSAVGGEAHGIGVELIAVMDTFLIATALYIFAVGMYELFISADLDIPEWLAIHNLHDLKVKLSGVIILVMAVTFLEHLIHWQDAAGTLMFGGAIAIVTGALIAFGHFGGKD